MVILCLVLCVLILYLLILCSLYCLLILFSFLLFHFYVRTEGEANCCLIAIVVAVAAAAAVFASARWIAVRGYRLGSRV